jgi:hypothetical protein
MNTAVFGARAAMVVAGLGAALGLAGLVSAGPRAPERPGSQERAYDADASRAKLERIHRALSLYRQEHGVKPVAEWRTMADAGLPPHPFVLAFEQGRPWSLPMDTFEVEGSDQAVTGKRPPTFFCYFLARPISKASADRHERFLHRGEELIYLVDDHLTPWKQQVGGDRRFDVLALRLNGTVEVVTMDGADPDGVLGK